MAEKPRAEPRMTIDVEAERAKAARALNGPAEVAEGAPLAAVDEALLAAQALFELLADCEASEGDLEAAARRVAALARRRADHEDADEAAPRATALERAAVALRSCGRAEEALAFSAESAERWLEASDDDRARQKEFLLRACDAFVGAERFDRAAGTYARAVALGEDPFERSRALVPSRGAHRLKLVLLLLAAGKPADARAVNDALTDDLTKAFERKVPRGQFEAALDRARALAEAHKVAGNAAGERQARVGAVDLALALLRREAKDGEPGKAAASALGWADEALSEALRAQDDALFLETYKRVARALVESALSVIEDGARPERRGEAVRLLFDAGRRFQQLGDETAAAECHARAYEVSPKYSAPDRRPSDEMTYALFLLKGPRADPEQAEVHLKNAAALAKSLIQAAGVSEDHPSARLRQLALREAFYRRQGAIKRHRETVEIMEVAATEGAAAALEKAAVKFNAGGLRDAREYLDEAVGYLERARGDLSLTRRALHARSLCFHLDPAGDRPESAPEYFARRDTPFDPKALGYDWRRIERALLAMDPPAEFASVRDALQFIKGRSPKVPAAGR